MRLEKKQMGEICRQFFEILVKSAQKIMENFVVLTIKVVLSRRTVPGEKELVDTRPKKVYSKKEPLSGRPHDSNAETERKQKTI